MKRFPRVLVMVLVLLSMSLHAKPKGNVMRGGLGFLFPDTNSFSNASQFTLNQSFSVEAHYTRLNLSQAQTLNNSFVYGNGKFGLGVFASRFSTNLASPSSAIDTLGVGFGAGLAKNKVTLGLGYDRVISSEGNNKGKVRGTFTLNGAAMGPSIGLGVFSTLDSTKVQGGTVGLGYTIKNGLKFEGDVEFNDFKDTKDLVGSFFLGWQNQKFYLGGGYGYLRLSSQHQASTRIGMVVGNNFDFSLHAAKTLLNTHEPTYGATLRGSF